jgi:predicted SnoaL-like aldol condensation-catalyzing enzyme
MNRKIGSCVLCLILACACALCAGCKNSQNASEDSQNASGNMIGLSTPNGRAARDFIDLWFNQHKPEEAFDRYVSRDYYMNHTTTTDVVQTFESEKAAEAKMTTSSMHFDIQQIVAQGDLVAMHILATGGGTKNGDELVEFLRFRDGKVIDHWDFHVPLQDKSAVFTGMNR